MDIGKRIKSRREQLGITQDELAKIVGYKSRSSINKIETEGRSIPQSKINSFSKALQLEAGYLLGLNNDEKKLVNFFDLLEFLKTLDCYIYPHETNECPIRNNETIVGCGDNICTECPNWVKSYKLVYQDKSVIISFQDFKKAKDEMLSFIRFKLNELINSNSSQT